jgi:hypothetical protein
MDTYGLERAVGGRRRGMGATGGRGTDQYNMGQRDPEVHNAKLDLAIDRAMGGAGTQAQQYRALQNASHAHMRSGRGVAGGGFLSDLGIPIISNLAGAIGLGQTGGRRRGRGQTGGASTGGAMCPMCGMGSTGGQMCGCGATGGGFLSSLGIPIISNLAGAIGLGKGDLKNMTKAQLVAHLSQPHAGMGATGGMMLGQDGHGQRRMGMGATGGRRRGRGATGGAYTGGMDSDSDEEGVEGAGFWDDFKSGFNSVIAPVASIAKPLLSLAGPEGRVASMGLSALGYGNTGGRRRGRGQTGGASTGGGDARRARGQMVSRLMREKGMSLGEASRYIKQHGSA